LGAEDGTRSFPRREGKLELRTQGKAKGGDSRVTSFYHGRGKGKRTNDKSLRENEAVEKEEDRGLEIWGMANV